jgi:hypothetical protein
VLRVLVVYNSNIAGVDSKAAKVTCFINLVKDKLLVQTLGAVNKAPATY